LQFLQNYCHSNFLVNRQMSTFHPISTGLSQVVRYRSKRRKKFFRLTFQSVFFFIVFVLTYFTCVCLFNSTTKKWHGGESLLFHIKGKKLLEIVEKFQQNLPSHSSLFVKESFIKKFFSIFTLPLKCSVSYHSRLNWMTLFHLNNFITSFRSRKTFEKFLTL